MADLKQEDFSKSLELALEGKPMRAEAMAGIEVLLERSAHQAQPPSQPEPAGVLRALARDIIDFRLERSRHTSFFGREDVLGAIDAALLRAAKSDGAGFVVLKGGPGMGKSAILSEWLRRREVRRREVRNQEQQGSEGQGRERTSLETPHHFIRRGQGSNNQPDVVVRNLVAQIATLYPDLVEADAALVAPELSPQRQLEKLLLAVSVARSSQGGAQSKSVPPLVLLIDGLDEADADPSRQRDNPVERMLPYRLPPGVVMVVASRPRYPHLGWLEQHDQCAPPLDLDSGAWSDSNHAAVKAYWAHFAPRFSPPLDPGFVQEAVERAQGNLLHAVKTREWLETVEPSERRAERLPVGLKGILEDLWKRLRDHERYGSPICEGLGLLCAAGDALPAYAIERALGWRAGSAGQQLLEPAREALLEEPGEWHGEPQPRYRLFHDALRDLLCQKLRGALQEHHEHLARRIATWPALESEGFGFDYALRFAVSHRVEAARLQGATAEGSREAGTLGKAWQSVVELCSCVPFLVAKVEHLGVTSLERDLESAARACPVDQGAEALRGLERAIRQESHWLRASAEGLPGLLYNQLLTRGWSAERLRQGLEWGDVFPGARLRNWELPLKKRESAPPALGWLHLSDWHVGMKDQGLWPSVRQALLEDLKRLHERSGPWHAVLFTGDLVQQGSAEEYAELDRRLGELWEAFGRLGSEPVLVAVPGNHDLMRPPRMDARLLALRQWHTDPELRDHFWSEGDNEYLTLVRAAFAPYAAWSQRDERFARVRPSWGRLPGDFSAVLEQGRLRVGVAGLNTGFLQLTGHDYEGQLDADVRQLNAACGGDAPAWLEKQHVNLLLSHHPPLWLDKKRALQHWRRESEPPGRFTVHLHGHLHEPGAAAVGEGGSASRHRLQGASLFGLKRFVDSAGERVERVHGYSAGKVELVGAEAGLGSGLGLGSLGGGVRIRVWPRRLVTKASGKRVIERDPEMELDACEAFTWWR